MKYLNVKDNFKKYLNNKTNLMSSSINTYSKIINQYIDSYGIEPNINNLNQFIKLKCRNRQPIVKYAIKYFLEFRWKHKNIYKQLTKAKVRPTIKKRQLITESQAMDIIHCIKKEEHKLIAKIQYFTGAKACEAISILKDNIILESEDKRIRIDVVGKGDKINSLYLIDNLWPEFNLYIVNEGPYMFIETDKVLNNELLRKKVETYYKRYYESLKEAANNLGLDMATHDWRKSFAEELKKHGADIYEVQIALRQIDTKTTRRIFKHGTEKIAASMLKHQTRI